MRALGLGLLVVGCNDILGQHPGVLVDASPCSMDFTTDPQNCGACGHDCGGGGCSASRCQPVELPTGTASIAGGYNLAVDQSSLYVTSWCTTTAVAAISLAGDATRVLAPGVQGATCGLGLAADATTLYTGIVDYASNVTTIESVAKAGGALASIASNIAGRATIVADDTELFFTLDHNWSPAPGVFSLPKSGAASPKLLHAAATKGLTADASYVYSGDNVTGSVFRIAKDGSQLTELCKVGAPSWFAVNATTLFWTDTFNRRILSIPIDGSGAYTVLTADLGYTPEALVVDSTTIYFTTVDGDIVGALDLDGNHFRVVADGQVGGSQAITADDKFVYWTTGVTSSSVHLWRVAK